MSKSRKLDKHSMAHGTFFFAAPKKHIRICKIKQRMNPQPQTTNHSPAPRSLIFSKGDIFREAAAGPIVSKQHHSRIFKVYSWRKSWAKPVTVSSNPTYIEVLRDLFYHVLPITLLRVFYGYLSVFYGFLLLRFLRCRNPRYLIGFNSQVLSAIYGYLLDFLSIYGVFRPKTV